MGKGPYFAQKIHELEQYLLKHHSLPLPKAHACLHEVTLLDIEDMQQGLSEHLIAGKIEDIIPHSFMKHVNKIILLALDIGS
jgi:hypothetical protein